MGQSQSLTHQQRKQHIRGHKTFGFIFFQKEFDNVVKPKKEAVENKYKIEREKYLINLKTAEYSKVGFNDWKVLKGSLEKDYDKKNKEKQMLEIFESFKPKQLFDNIENVMDDANKMYEFLQGTVCQNLTEVTIMCDQKEFTKIVRPKPQDKTFFELIVKQKDLWKKHKSTYIVNHYKSIGLCLDWNDDQEQDKQMEYELKYEKIQFLEEQVYLHSIGQQSLPKLQIENFTKKPSALQLEMKKRLFSHMIPEVTRPFEKLQYNFLYQFLSLSTRKKLLKLQKPNHLEPSKQNYEAYVLKILEYANLHKQEEILSIQTFAGHGMIVNGKQKVLTNNYCVKEQFYELIDVEQVMRDYSKKMVNVFFLMLFACCREYYKTGKNTGICRKHGDTCQGCVFHLHPKSSNSNNCHQKKINVADQIPNFTMIFGSAPESGVPADTNLVEVFVDHLNQFFNPKTGSVKIPQILDLIECDKAEVESSSSNEGKQLEMFRQDTRIGVKFLIIISNGEDMSQSMHIAKKTFQKSLCFEEREILHLTLDEAYKLQNLFQFAQPQQQCNQTTLKLKKFAEAIFSKHTKLSNQLLQVFLLEPNEQMNEDAQFGNLLNFIFQRNPELALFIFSKLKDVTKYFQKIEQKVLAKQVVSFENFNTFFHIQEGVVEQIGQADFKPYSGPFRYQLETGPQKVQPNQTIARQFEVLKILPLRIYNTNGISFGFPANDTESIIISLNPEIMMKNSKAKLHRNESIQLGIQKPTSSTIMTHQNQEHEQKSSVLQKRIKTISGDLTNVCFMIQRVQFVYPYEVKDEVAFKVKKPQNVASIQPFRILTHNHEQKQIFFSINFKSAVKKIVIFSLKYGKVPIEYKKQIINLDQECMINLQACEAEQFGIYIYIFSKDDSNPKTPSCLSVYQIQDGKEPQLKHEKQRFYDFLLQNDKNFVSKIIQIRRNFFDTLELNHLTSQSSDPYRIVYASNNMKCIFDLKMGNCKLVSYPERDILEGKAIGIQTLPKIFSIDMYTSQQMWMIVEKNLRTQICFNVQMENLHSGQTALEHLKFKNLSPEDRKFVKVLPISYLGDKNRSPEFSFVFRKQSVSILQIASLKEFKIIRLNQCHASDCLTDAFITEGIPNVTLHYFEQIHDYYGSIKYRTYNVFPMFQDFWNAIQAFDGVPPLSPKNFTDKFHQKVKENDAIKRRSTVLFNKQEFIKAQPQAKLGDQSANNFICGDSSTNKQDLFEIRLKVLEEKLEEKEQKLQQQIKEQFKELYKVKQQLLSGQKAAIIIAQKIEEKSKTSSFDSSSNSSNSSSEKTKTDQSSKIEKAQDNQDIQKSQIQGFRQNLAQRIGKLHQLKQIFSQENQQQQQKTDLQPDQNLSINLANIKEELFKHVNDMFFAHQTQISRDFYRKEEIDEKLRTMKNFIETKVMEQKEHAENQLQLHSNTLLKPPLVQIEPEIDEKSPRKNQSDQLIDSQKNLLLNMNSFSSFASLRFDSMQDKKKETVVDLNQLKSRGKQFVTEISNKSKRHLVTATQEGLQIKEQTKKVRPIVLKKVRNFQQPLLEKYRMEYTTQIAPFLESLNRPNSSNKSRSKKKQAQFAQTQVSPKVSFESTRRIRRSVNIDKQYPDFNLTPQQRSFNNLFK